MRLAATADLAASADDAPVLDQAKRKTFGFVTGIASFVGANVLVLVASCGQPTSVKFGDVGYTKTLATISCVGNIAYVSPNIATLVNAMTDNWYSKLNNVMTEISILKGIAAARARPFNKYEGGNPLDGIAFAFAETFINVVWNVPVIANIVVNKDVWNTTYKSLIPESIGNFSFHLGGILEFPIALAPELAPNLP